MTSHTRPLMVHHLSRAPPLTVGASQLLERMPCRGFGGLSLINAGLTVFLARPTTRAICEIDMPSDRRKRRISAQSREPYPYRLDPFQRERRLHAPTRGSPALLRSWRVLPLGSGVIFASGVTLGVRSTKANHVQDRPHANTSEKILRSTAEPPMELSSLPRPVGFVLGGGGSLGAIQVGMLQALAVLTTEVR